MARFVAEKAVKQLSRAGFAAHGSKAIVAGLTFKEDCPDLRNSKVADLIAELRNYGLDVHVHDPVVDAEEAEHEYGIALEPWEKLPRAELVVLAVAHRQLLERSARDYAAKAAPRAVFVDVKSRFDRAALERERLSVWRL